MQLTLLHLDEALKTQPEFLEHCRSRQAREIEAGDLASPIRLWGKEPALDALQTRLRDAMPPDGRTQVTFMGSGDFHHVSALLIGLLVERADAPVTIIHFDNHPDWVHFSGGMHCGSWVNRALSLPQVKRVITLGVCSNDLRLPEFKGANLRAMQDGDIVVLPYRRKDSRVFRQYGEGAGYMQAGSHIRWHNLAAMPQETLEKTLATLIPTRNVYITIDKDVLSHQDALTNWDQGEMPLDHLLAGLRYILTHHHAVGIDVTGDYSAPHYTGSRAGIALKKLEILLDQPLRRPSQARAAAVNQQSNQALLTLLSEAV